MRYTGKTYPVTVKLDVGSIFSVSLKSNPTTGYSWSTVDKDMEDCGLLNVIQYLDQEYKENPNPRGLLGVGGVTKMRFKIIGAGKGPLHLFYAQQWELDAKIERSESITEDIGMSIPI